MTSTFNFILEVTFDLSDRDWDEEKMKRFAASELERRLKHPFIDYQILVGCDDDKEVFWKVRKASPAYS